MESKKELIKVWPRVDLTKETYMTRVTGPRGGMRGYEREGVEGTYPSVTTVLSTINKPALPNWYAKKVAEKAGELISDIDQRQACLDEYELTNFMQTIKSAPSESFKESGDIGNQVHDLINKSIRYKMNNPYTSWDETGYEFKKDLVSIEVDTAFNNWLSWIKTMPDVGLYH